MSLQIKILFFLAAIIVLIKLFKKDDEIEILDESKKSDPEIKKDKNKIIAKTEVKVPESIPSEDYFKEIEKIENKEQRFTMFMNELNKIKSYNDFLKVSNSFEQKNKINLSDFAFKILSKVRFNKVKEFINDLP